MLGCANSKPWMCTKVATELASPGHWNHSFRVRGQSQFSQSRSEEWHEFSEVFRPVLSLDRPSFLCWSHRGLLSQDRVSFPVVKAGHSRPMRGRASVSTWFIQYMVCMGSSAKTSNGHPHRHQRLKDHKPKHGQQQQFGIRYHHDLR